MSDTCRDCRHRNTCSDAPLNETCAGFNADVEGVFARVVADAKARPFVHTPPALAASTLARLRELRQWHMTQAKAATANRDKAASGELAERYRKEWALHMGAVQTLNEFFPNGDYAQ